MIVPDREKIVEKLSIEVQVAEYSFRDKMSIDLGIIKDTIELLKEQNDAIEKAYSMLKIAEDKIKELLKEQEAVEPIPYHRSDGTIFKYECRKCRTKIFKFDLFCRHCGRSVKWE